MMEIENNSERISFITPIKESVYLTTSFIVFYIDGKSIIELISEIVTFTSASQITFEQLYLFIQMVLIETFIKSRIMRIVAMYIFGTIYSLC